MASPRAPPASCGCSKAFQFGNSGSHLLRPQRPDLSAGDLQQSPYTFAPTQGRGRRGAPSSSQAPTRRSRSGPRSQQRSAPPAGDAQQGPYAIAPVRTQRRRATQAPSQSAARPSRSGPRSQQQAPLSQAGQQPPADDFDPMDESLSGRHLNAEQIQQVAAMFAGTSIPARASGPSPFAAPMGGSPSVPQQQSLQIASPYAFRQPAGYRYSAAPR